MTKTTNHRQVWVGVTWTVLAALSGCGREAEPITFSVADSSGVRVASNGPIIGLRAPWRLSRRAVMRIGWRDDEPTFENIRTGRFAEDGSVVIGDQIGSTVWRVNLEGEVVGNWGRRGDGPGELRAVSVVLPDGDSAIVQTEDGLVTVFGPDGFARSFRSPERDRPLRGMTEGGALLFSAWQPNRVVDPDRRWVDGVVYRRPRGGGAPDTLLTYPLGLTWPGPRTYDPFAPAGALATTDTSLIVWRSDKPEIRWYGLDGAVRQIVRWDHERQAVTDEDWQAFAEAYAGLSSREVDPSSGQKHANELRPTASTARPIFGPEMHVDPDGNLWLGEYVGSYRDPTRYSILAAGGHWLGAIELPPRFLLLDVSDHYVLGVEQDEWDVQAVSVYEIRKAR
jgi:hypothetical protein